MLLGGTAALSPVGGRGAANMSQRWPLARWEHRAVGPDVYLHGWTRSDEPS
jgi:hypothetical protein